MADIIIAEVAADELEVAQDFARRDDDAVAQQNPMTELTRRPRNAGRSGASPAPGFDDAIPIWRCRCTGPTGPTSQLHLWPRKACPD